MGRHQRASAIRPSQASADSDEGSGYRSEPFEEASSSENEAPSEPASASAGHTSTVTREISTAGMSAVSPMAAPTETALANCRQVVAAGMAIGEASDEDVVGSDLLEAPQSLVNEAHSCTVTTNTRACRSEPLIVEQADSDDEDLDVELLLEGSSTGDIPSPTTQVVD